jgi:hypothetical protein
MAFRVFGKRVCAKEPHPIVAADASGMVTDDLAQATAQRCRHTQVALAQHPGPGHPNPSLANPPESR